MGGDPRARAPRGSSALSDGTLLADTNIFIRYLTGAPEDQFLRVRQLFDDGIPVVLADAVVAEIVYVLESIFHKDRRAIADAIRSLVSEPNVFCERKSALLFATDVYELTHLHWIDGYLAASATTRKHTQVLSFDRGIDEIKDVRVEP